MYPKIIVLISLILSLCAVQAQALSPRSFDVTQKEYEYTLLEHEMLQALSRGGSLTDKDIQIVIRLDEFFDHSEYGYSNSPDFQMTTLDILNRVEPEYKVAFLNNIFNHLLYDHPTSDNDYNPEGRVVSYQYFILRCLADVLPMSELEQFLLRHIPVRFYEEIIKDSFIQRREGCWKIQWALRHAAEQNKIEQSEFYARLLSFLHRNFDDLGWQKLPYEDLMKALEGEISKAKNFEDFDDLNSNRSDDSDFPGPDEHVFILDFDKLALQDDLSTTAAQLQRLTANLSPPGYAEPYQRLVITIPTNRSLQQFPTLLALKGTIEHFLQDQELDPQELKANPIIVFDQSLGQTFFDNQRYLESLEQESPAIRFFHLSMDDILKLADKIGIDPGFFRLEAGFSNAGFHGMRNVSFLLSRVIAHFAQEHPQDSYEQLLNNIAVDEWRQQFVRLNPVLDQTGPVGSSLSPVMSLEDDVVLHPHWLLSSLKLLQSRPNMFTRMLGRSWTRQPLMAKTWFRQPLSDAASHPVAGAIIQEPVFAVPGPWDSENEISQRIERPGLHLVNTDSLSWHLASPGFKLHSSRAFPVEYAEQSLLSTMKDWIFEPFSKFMVENLEYFQSIESLPQNERLIKEGFLKLINGFSSVMRARWRKEMNYVKKEMQQHSEYRHFKEQFEQVLSEDGKVMKEFNRLNAYCLLVKKVMNSDPQKYKADGKALVQEVRKRYEQLADHEPIAFNKHKPFGQQALYSLDYLLELCVGGGLSDMAQSTLDKTEAFRYADLVNQAA